MKFMVSVVSDEEVLFLTLPSVEDKKQKGEGDGGSTSTKWH